MLYLVRTRPGHPEDRNSSQVNAYIVDADDAAGARAAAVSAAPSGECKPKATWDAVPLDSAATPLFVQGAVVIPGNAERLRGA